MIVLVLAGASAMAQSGGSVAEAAKSFSQGRLEEASRLLRAAGAAADEPGELMLRGRVALATMDVPSALAMFTKLAATRGTADDLLLLASAQEMAGQFAAMQQSIDKALAAKDASPQALYDLAWRAQNATDRTAILKRIASSLAKPSSTLTDEIAFWEGLKDTLLCDAPAIGDAGLSWPMKTLYNMEWVAATVADDREMWLMVDTTAPETVITKDIAHRLHLTPIKGAYSPASALDGEEPPLYCIIPSLNFGGYVVKNIVARIAKDQVGLMDYRDGRAVLKGILGMNLLRSHPFFIDRAGMRLRILPEGADEKKFIESEGGHWQAIPAGLCQDRCYVRLSLNGSGPSVFLLDSGSTEVLLTEEAVASLNYPIKAGTKVDLCPSVNAPFTTSVVQTPAAVTKANTTVIMGWLSECLPLQCQATVLRDPTKVNFGSDGLVVVELPVLRTPLRGAIVARGVLGRKVLNAYSVVFFPQGGKLYARRNYS
jgi:predicted aspartyl protease